MHVCIWGGNYTHVCIWGCIYKIQKRMYIIYIIYTSTDKYYKCVTSIDSIDIQYDRFQMLIVVTFVVSY